MKLLFVCTENRLRSTTAEALFSKYPGVQAIGAGISAGAETRVSAALIEWADVVLVMEERQRVWMTQQYPEQMSGKRVVCLDIADVYPYMHPVLVRLLEEKVREHVRL